MRFLLFSLALAALPGAPRAQNCSGISVGFVPLNDLGAETYQGFSAGLYPGGFNMRPAAHDAAGLAQAALVIPRDGAGAPDPTNGKIGLVSIGMSNTSQEFTSFLALANADPAKSPKVVPVNGAQGGQTAQIISNPAANFWNVVDQRLALAGLTPAQVQAVWLKEANAAPTQPFPQHAEILRDQLRTILQIIKTRYPNTRLAYLSSRIYAGYATTGLNPEPKAYESGFSVKWLVEEQIAGSPALNFDPAAGPVLAPWIAWGPYTWADGLAGRSDGLIWACTDFQADGTHPSPLGQAKVAERLSHFFKTDATAKTWYLSSPTPLCGPQALVEPYGTGAGGPNGIARLVGSEIPTHANPVPFRAHAWGAPRLALGAFLMGLAPLPDGAVPLLGGPLLVQPLLGFPGPTSLLGKASLVVGAIPPDPALCGGEVFFQYVVADPDPPSGFDVSRGLRVRVGH
jgi:hypothetical protein